MIRVILITVIMFAASFCYANPFLMAEPVDDVDYYVMSINGEQLSVAPSSEDLFLYDLESLQPGKYRMEIITGHWDCGEGEPVVFFLTVQAKRKQVVYKIQKDRKQKKIDSAYDERFDQPLDLKIVYK